MFWKREKIRNKVKIVKRVLTSLAALFLITTSTFGDDATNDYNSGHAKFVKGDFDGALADYNKAIELKPDYADAYIGRGDVKYKKSDPKGALTDYNKAIELKPDSDQIPDLARTPEAIVTNKIAMQALTLFEAKDYDKLDELAAKLRSSKERYADGVWKLSCVYDGLVPLNRTSDEEWETRLSDIGRWAIARPDSITPRVAWANILVAYAWKARGGGEIDTVTSEGRRLFVQRLTYAAMILNEAKSLKEQCPLYWRVLMRAALGLQVDETRFNAIFDEAIKFDPDCESYYFRRAIYLLPRWNGGEGEWQNDLTKSADKIGGENGDMVYAQVIWNMNQPSYFENPFMEDNVSWTRVDKGFEVIGKIFPDSLAAKIERAQLAVLFNEAQAAFHQATLYYNSGNEKQDKGDWTDAITDYNKAIEIKSSYAKAYGNRGNAKRAKGDLDGAMADFNKAIEIKPDYALAYYNRATTERAKGDMDGAMADFTKAIQLKSDFAQAYDRRGTLEISQKDFDDAIADFTKAIKLNPKYAEAYSNRGEAELRKGDWDGALTDYNKAIEFNPDDENAYYARAAVKRHKSDLNGALADYNMVIQLKPDDAMDFYIRGMLKAKMGDTNGSIADFNKAIELNPKAREAIKAQGYSTIQIK